MNLDTCPNCGGPADNGHDRCVPPNPYFCTKCNDPQPQEQTKDSSATSPDESPAGCGPSRRVAEMAFRSVYADKLGEPAMEPKAVGLKPVALVHQDYTTNMLQLIAVKNNLPIGAELYSANTVSALTKERNVAEELAKFRMQLAEERFQEIAALQAELAEAKACIANQAAQITGKHQYVGQDFKFRMDRLQAENAELRKDAERYRLLRSKGYLALANGMLTDKDDLMHAGTELDAAIDAAMKDGK